MRIGVIGSGGGWSSEILADAVDQATGHRLLIEMDRVRLDLPSGRAWYEGVDISGLDAVIIKKIGARYSPDLLDRLEVLRCLEERGLRVFSSPAKILRVLDRLSCTVTLHLAGIPMPPTTVTEDVDEALKAVEKYGEAVFKPLYTSKARGMVVVRNGDGARQAVEAFSSTNPIMYIQEKIHSLDMDLGVAFLGGEYMITYARCKQNDSWNTSTASGATYAPFAPSLEIIEMARRAQSLFGLDFTCVDVALTKDGPLIFEVSAFGGFRGIQETSDMEPAKRLVEHVMRRLDGTGAV